MTTIIELREAVLELNYLAEVIEMDVAEICRADVSIREWSIIDSMLQVVLAESLSFHPGKSPSFGEARPEAGRVGSAIVFACHVATLADQATAFREMIAGFEAEDSGLEEVETLVDDFVVTAEGIQSELFFRGDFTDLEPGMLIIKLPSKSDPDWVGVRDFHTIASEPLTN